MHKYTIGSETPFHSLKLLNVNFFLVPQFMRRLKSKIQLLLCILPNASMALRSRRHFLEKHVDTFVSQAREDNLIGLPHYTIMAFLVDNKLL